MATTSIISVLQSIVTTPLKHLKALILQTQVSGSIARGVGAAQVNPITLVDSTLRFDERLTDTLNVSVNLYAGIYLQGIALSNTTVAGTQIIKRLEKLNPTNSTLGLGLESLDNASEHGIVDQMLPEGDEYELPSLESMTKFVVSTEDATDGQKEYKGAKDPEKVEINTMGRASDALRDVPELAVGKLINVDLRADGETHSIPIAFRLATTMAQQASIVAAMKNRFAGVETAIERKVKYKSGTITGFMDRFLCMDLVRNHYKQLIASKDGVYAKLSPEKSKAYLRALLTGEVSVAQASNVLILSADTAQRVEGMTGGRFSSKNYRDRMLEATGIMILCVVDPMEDTVTIYIDGLEGEQMVTGRNMAKASKKDGPDVGEVLRVLVEGRGSLIR